MSPEGVNFISRGKSFETIINTRAKIHWTWYSAQLGTKDFIYIVFGNSQSVPSLELMSTGLQETNLSVRVAGWLQNLSHFQEPPRLKPSDCSKSQLAPIGLKNIHSLIISYSAYWRLIPQETWWKQWKVRGHKPKPKPLPDIDTLPNRWSWWWWWWWEERFVSFAPLITLGQEAIFLASLLKESLP